VGGWLKIFGVVGGVFLFSSATFRKYFRYRKSGLKPWFTFISGMAILALALRPFAAVAGVA